MPLYVPYRSRSFRGFLIAVVGVDLDMTSTQVTSAGSSAQQIYLFNSFHNLTCLYQVNAEGQLYDRSTKCNFCRIACIFCQFSSKQFSILILFCQFSPAKPRSPTRAGQTRRAGSRDGKSSLIHHDGRKISLGVFLGQHNIFWWWKCLLGALEAFLVWIQQSSNELRGFLAWSG